MRIVAHCSLVFRCSILLAGGLACAGFAGEQESLSFNEDVRPILSDNCFTCHGQDAGSRKSGLRLDLRAAALKGGDSGKAAIVPGKPDASELIARITTHDPDDLMPPASTGKGVTPAQAETLRKWIAAGAEYQPHWAFIPPVRPRGKWDRSEHPIDAMVGARLTQEKLAFSPAADRATLLRRLCLDLTGLPPSIQEIDSFIADQSPDAVVKQVDRLLGSPRFGEKWARHWLDAARYADSDGYEKDLPRNQWPWRDWVINALNRDLPYDQFIIEQLAGDLLPNATQDQQVATGFLRNGMVNEEGAIIAEQFRLEGLFDRMDCLGKAVLGLTLQCAQCHSHKFDPLSQEEYYGLFAFINNDYEKTSWVYTPDQLETIRNIRAETVAIEKELKGRHADWKQRLAAWEESTRTNLVQWTPLDASEHEWAGGLAHPEKLPDLSILTLGFRPTEGELFVSVPHTPAGMTGLRLDALTHGDLPFGGPGRSYKGTFAISEMIVEAASLNDGNWAQVAFTNVVAEFAEKERPLEKHFKKANDHRLVGPAHFLVDSNDETAWGTDRGPGLRHQDVSWAAAFHPDTAWPTNGTRLKITFKYRHGGEDIHGRQNNFLGRFRLSVTTNAEPTREIVPLAIRRILETPAKKRSANDEAELFAYWRSTVPEFKEFNDRIDAAWKKHPEGGTVLNLAQRDPEFTRETSLLERGDWQKPTTKIEPGTPEFLHPFPKKAPINRLGLAQWLVDRKSPTTARAFVNRVWQSMFGMGLVETSEDFGVRAAPPTHPQLLDWLAVEFMEPTFNKAPDARPWSVKHLVRTIVLSKTYQQQSAVTPELLEIDPRNQLLSRGPRFRAEAEVVRDIALHASGLLHEKVGGPSIFPPVPDSFFAQSFAKIDFWHTATGPERYRRSLYVFRRRSMPDPALASFDAPPGDFACVRRVLSNTPLSALTSLNEPVFVEAARALALRALKEGGNSNEERVQFAFRLCTGRAARPEEVAEVLGLLKSREERISEGWLAANELMESAERFKLLPPGVTPREAAAWTIVSRLLLNLDATLCKN